MMTEWFPLAVHLLEGAFFGNKAAQQAVSQRERLLALGSLSAGLTHELNNPAAAAVRATAALRERVAGMRHKLGILTRHNYHQATLESLIEMQERAVERVSKAPALGPMEASDAEDAVGDWLDGYGIAGSWDLAPVLVQAGLDTEWLDQVAEIVGTEDLDGAVRWLAYTVETELLMDEIQDSTGRIMHLVGAAKQYSQLDRAPYQEIDVHDLLDSTLLMLAARSARGSRSSRTTTGRCRRSRPTPAELNQVWTNLIDNAVSAMGGQGTLTVRTAMDREKLLIDFGDTGPGVPPDIQPRIFEPFFTTKPVGEGTGLGLDISWRIVMKHHGEINVFSSPGDTHFRVWLPVTAPDPDRPDAPDGPDGPTAGASMTEVPGVNPSVPPSGNGCAECDAAGGWWFHLRRCAQCGHVGCCDSSPAQHASGHAKEDRPPGHPELRAGGGVVLELPGRAALRARPGAGPAAPPPARSAHPRPRRPGARRLAGPPAFTSRPPTSGITFELLDAAQAAAYAAELQALHAEVCAAPLRQKEDAAQFERRFRVQRRQPLRPGRRHGG